MNPKLLTLSLLFCALFAQSFSQAKWTQHQIITGERNLGKSIDFDGKSILATDLNKAYIFQWKDTCWIKKYILSLPEEDTVISAGIYGRYALLGLPQQNLAHLFNFTGTAWNDTIILHPDDLSDSDQFGFSVTIDSNFLFVSAIQDDDSAENCGSVYVYQKDVTGWNLVQKLFPSDAHRVKKFGLCMAVCGDHLVVGSDSASYFFYWDGIQWAQQSKVLVRAVGVSISDEYAIIGSNYNKVKNIAEVCAYYFHLNGSIWNERYLIEGFGNRVVKGGDLLGSGERVYTFQAISGNLYEASIINLDYSGKIFISNNMILISDPGYISEVNPGEKLHSGAVYCYFLKSAPRIHMTELLDKQYGDLFYHLCSYSITSSDPGIAKIEGDKIRCMGVGTCEIVASNKADSLYYSVTKSWTLTVNKGSLYITADNKKKEYYSSNPVYTMSFFGFKNYDDINDLQELPSLQCSADTSSDAGVYPIEISGGTDENYSFELTNGNLEITQAPLLVEAVDLTKTYGSENPPFTYNITGFKNQEDISVLDQLPVISCSATKSSRVGKYALIPKLGSDNNYSYNYIRGFLTVVKAPLLVKVTDTTRYFGQNNPDFEIEYSGFVNNENESVIDLLPVPYCSADSLTAPGSYAINVSGGIDYNYEFIYADGTLTINSRVGNSNLTGNDIHVWPNPTSGKVFVHNSGTKQATLFNSSGIMVNKLTINAESIDLTDLPEGIYFIQIGTQSFKIMKQ